MIIVMSMMAWISYTVILRLENPTNEILTNKHKNYKT